MKRTQNTHRLALIAGCLLFALPGAISASSISVANAGFEDPVLDDGAFQGGSPPGWTTYGQASFGVLNPTTGDFLGQAAEGENTAFIGNAISESGITQTLSGPTGRFGAGASYNLDLKVGNTAFTPGFPGYKVQLLAGETVLVEDDNTLAPAAGTYVNPLLNYSYNDELHGALVGEPLVIRLISKASDASEVHFDDVRLSVSLAAPIADTGGPYLVAAGASLALDASGSLPSDGQDITTYEWDLTNNGEFTDATGATPSAISADDLINVIGMGFGPNTIHLRVTDSSDKISTVSTTVTLVSAVATPGFGLYFNAGEAADDDTHWNDLVEGNPTNLGLLLDKTEDRAVTRVPVSDSRTILSHAYRFPGGLEGTIGGALLVDAGTSTARSFNIAGWHTQNVSMELWIKPDTITPPTTNGYTLFEDGGGTGLGFFIRDNQIRFRKIAGVGDLSYNLSTDPSGVLDASPTEDFIQIVGTFDVSSGAMQLFVNGVRVVTGSSNGGSWTGGDAAAFGTRGGNNVGGLGSGQQATQSFAGEFGLIRVYSQIILTPEEVDSNYKAIAPDVTPPLIAALDPENNAAGIYPGIGSLSATFNENIQLTGVGSITLKNLDVPDGSSDVLLNLPDASVTQDGDRTVRISLASNLAFGTNFAVHISDDAVRDVTGNLFAGIDDDTTWTFGAAAQNLNPPLISEQFPQDGATGASILPTITATFDQNLIAGTGDIIIRDLTDDSTTKTIPVTDTTRVSVVGNVLTVRPATPLASATSYAVLIPATALRNFSEVAFAGISSDTGWTFTTSDLTSQLGILNITANDGINPATGEPWNHADRFRLVFISSEEIDPKLPTPLGDWNEIETWNALAQQFANNGTGHDLSGATWRVLGSTPTVSARDNTATNPFVHGNGHPVIRMDGSTIVAADFNELWGGELRNVVFLTENAGQNINDAPAIPWPFTGSTATGTPHGAGGSLRDISGGGAIRQGQGDNLRGWIDRANFTVAAQDNRPRAIYGISDPLFVYDLLDESAPSLVSFEDDVTGGPILFPDDVVVYTVAFNEAMLPSTVTAAVFENAEATPIAIQSVVQLEDPALFEVTVAPLDMGAMRLQIKAGALLTDLNGNPLDTSEALADDTVIQVQGEPAASYATWAAGFTGLTDTNPALDFDRGGLATGIEWVVGGDPTNPTDDAAFAPLLDNDSDPDFVVFTYRRTHLAAADANTTIAVEYGDDLLGWTVAEAGPNVEFALAENGAGEGIDLVSVKLRRTLAPDGRLFARLSVTVATP